MPAGESMRDRVTTGIGASFCFSISTSLLLWWNLSTTTLSVWWVASILLLVLSISLLVWGLMNVLSGFSGFGRNFFEVRDPYNPPLDASCDDHKAAVNDETSGVLGFPMMMFVLSALLVALMVFPAMNFIPEFDGDNWISPGLLAPLILASGFILIAWCIMLQSMMKTGPDRWTHIPGSRDQIRSYIRFHMVIGMLLVVIGYLNIF